MSKILPSLLLFAALFPSPGNVDCAQAQSITSYSAAPPTYSGPGQQITFKFNFNSGDFVVQSVKVVSSIGVNYNCSGGANGQTGQNVACAGVYTTKAGDLPNPI